MFLYNSSDDFHKSWSSRHVADGSLHHNLPHREIVLSCMFCISASSASYLLYMSFLWHNQYYSKGRERRNMYEAGIINKKSLFLDEAKFMYCWFFFTFCHFSERLHICVHSEQQQKSGSTAEPCVFFFDAVVLTTVLVSYDSSVYNKHVYQITKGQFPHRSNNLWKKNKQSHSVKKNPWHMCSFIVFVYFSLRQHNV